MSTLAADIAWSDQQRTALDAIEAWLKSGNGAPF